MSARGVFQGVIHKCRAKSGRPCGVVLSKEMADVFERQVLPRLVGPARHCSRRVSSHTLVLHFPL